ncbi:MAG: FAD-dependent oxidoreductase, partial [Gemmatimonadales bacterium]
MRQLFRRTPMWRRRDLESQYEAVIIGGGVHGLATAYYLARLGLKRIAVLEMSYIGSGGSGRNTAIIRANYRTPEGVPFYARSVAMYQRLGEELDYNLLFSQQGHLTLAHTDAAVTGLRIRAEVNQLLGVDSRVIWPEEIARLVPGLDLSSHPRYPILAALFHPPGGIIRHDAVVWGYARAADRLGVSIHPFSQVTGIRLERNHV